MFIVEEFTFIVYLIYRNASIKSPLLLKAPPLFSVFFNKRPTSNIRPQPEWAFIRCGLSLERLSKPLWTPYDAGTSNQELKL